MSSVSNELQWGGRFTAPPDPSLIAFGSSLADDLVLAPFDVRCSLAHVVALEHGGAIDASTARGLREALDAVALEIESGSFAKFTLRGTFEDIHGAIDARIRALTPPEVGEALHAGRSRNDQVATDLLLYARDRATTAMTICARIAEGLLQRAATALDEGTIVAATTHWQPAQPVLLGFWLHASAEGFIRAAHRFGRLVLDARASCPLGSGAIAGSSLRLDRVASARFLGFDAPSRNAMDAVGDRDVALDLLGAVSRAVLWASRPAEELVLWTTPAFGFATLGDAAATGSSLMPQKKNPDPFELVRGVAGVVTGLYTGALASVKGLALSYHRDLQETKSAVLRGTERGLAALDAFERAVAHVTFDAQRMNEHAALGFTVATDVADALIDRGVSARAAHRLVGELVAHAERDGRTAFVAADLDWMRAHSGIVDLQAPLTAAQSVEAKATIGSTNSEQVRRSIDASARALALVLSEAA